MQNEIILLSRHDIEMLMPFGDYVDAISNAFGLHSEGSGRSGLNGLESRKSGTIEGYDYSEPNKKANITWSEASFKGCIKDPVARIPGTKMQFPGIKDDKRIADLWAYLKQFGPDGKTK